MLIYSKHNYWLSIHTYRAYRNNTHMIVFIDKIRFNMIHDWILVQYICYLDQTDCFHELNFLGIVHKFTFCHWELETENIEKFQEQLH